jgi:WD40-like Beta Propeller Repeat
VMPRNVGDFEIHWNDAHGNDVFEVSLHTAYSDLKLYTKGANGIAGTGPTPSWIALQASEWFTTVGTANNVSFQVRGATTATPGNVGAAAMQTVELSHEDMNGGLYYWAASSAAPDAVTGIYRHDMARPGEPAEEFMTTKQTAGRCVACHVLSRDGTKMAVTFDGGGKPATLVDVGTRTAAPITTAWDFGTFTPDNTQFLSIENSTLTVRDTTTQAVLATMDSDFPVSHPDLSPDGRRLVYASNPRNEHDWQFDVGSLYTRSYNATTHAFGPVTPLVDDGANNFYPSWSPDGNWIVFNKAAADSYDDANATTWVIKSDGSQPAVELVAADSTAGTTNSWPRWAPFPQTLASNNEPMFWITMASKRDFGVRLRNTGKFQRPAQGSPAKSSQIWMTPFCPARAEQKKDPSAPVFRLPFQNLTSSNHIAQWTERVIVIQ